MRKTSLALCLTAFAAAGIARAEVVATPIASDVIQQYASFALPFLQQQLTNPPVKTEPDAEKAVGYQLKDGDKEVYLLAVPEKDLTAKVIEDAGEKGKPIGMLITTSMSIEEKDEIIPADRLSIIDFNGQVKIPVFYFTVRAKEQDRILEVFSKDDKPICAVTLKKQTGDASAPLALKLGKIDQEKKRLDATLSFGGAYEGTLKLAFLKL